MRLMIDTNIILDVLLKRKDFYETSKSVLDMCEAKKILGFVSASSITDIFYLVRRALRSVDETYKVIDALLNIVGVLSVTSDDVQRAFLKHAKDFEDCLLAESAKSNKCSGIVTRNGKDFQQFGINIYTPEEILSLLLDEKQHDA